jgi:predicted nucleotide-binding protein (sugar kinase/HSP70/actin superfamily)
VGEIYLKFNPFAHRNVTGWLMDRGIEIVPPVLTDFFLQYFVNRRTKKQSGLDRSRVPEFVFDGFYSFLMKKVREVDHIASVFRYYRPFGDIFEEAGYGRELISLNAIFGEGWLLPAEIASYCRHGVNNVISLQPFGCIANHIVERGIENKIKKTYHNINLLSIDFDSGVSDVNIVNRLLLFLDNIRMPDQSSPCPSGHTLFCPPDQSSSCHPERSEGSVTLSSITETQRL